MCTLDPHLDPDLEIAGCGDAGGTGELMMENSTGVQRPPLQDKLLPVGVAARVGSGGDEGSHLFEEQMDSSGRPRQACFELQGEQPR